MEVLLEERGWLVRGGEMRGCEIRGWEEVRDWDVLGERLGGLGRGAGVARLLRLDPELLDELREGGETLDGEGGPERVWLVGGRLRTCSDFPALEREGPASRLM